MYVNYRGKCSLLKNVTPPRGDLQSSLALSDIFLRVIKIAGQSRILEFLKRVATRNFPKKNIVKKHWKWPKTKGKNQFFGSKNWLKHLIQNPALSSLFIFYRVIWAKCGLNPTFPLGGVIFLRPMFHCKLWTLYGTHEYLINEVA